LTIQVLGQVYEPLIGVNAAGDLEPLLADSWSSEDGITWTITLRERRPVHGVPEQQLTGHDVKASLERLTRADSYNSFVLSGVIVGSREFTAGETDEISGIRAIDEKTIEISLYEPQESFPYRLAFPGLLIHRPAEEGERPAGTGPFEIVSIDATGRINMERFGAYPDTPDMQERVDALTFEPVADSALRAHAVAQGELDFAVVDRRALSSLPEDAPVAIYEWLPYNIHFVGFNIERVQSPDLRRAISLALDREAVRDRIIDGGAVTSSGFIPPNMAAGQGPSLPQVSEQELQRMIEESGYDGRALQLVVHQQANSEQIGEYVRSRLSDLGISVGVDTVDFNTALTRMVEGSSDMFSMYFDYSYIHPGLVLDAFVPQNIPAPNFWRYRPSDDILENMITLRRSAPMDEALRQLEAEIVQDSPAAFLFAELRYVIQNEGFDGVDLSPVSQLDLVQLVRN
jgi:peptide/nickel transport system substrate-binding protein/oligopeptide transport system substrate-binding protein